MDFTNEQQQSKVETVNLNFSEALDLLKQGNKLQRAGWNGSGMFAVLSPGFENLPAEKFFNSHLAAHASDRGGFMTVRPSFMLKTAQDDVAYWVPSCSDILANDWQIVE